MLDPACGSGNFLFLGLKTLKDIELKSHVEAEALGLDRQADLVTGPHNMLGLELNEYAAELARVTVWIGELQWRLLHGFALMPESDAALYQLPFEYVHKVVYPMRSTNNRRAERGCGGDMGKLGQQCELRCEGMRGSS